MVAGLAAVALTPVGTAQLIAVCAGSQLPVYVVGLAAGVRLLPLRGGSWWSAVVATLAVSSLLPATGRYLLAPAVVAAGVAAVAVVRRRPGPQAAGPSALPLACSPAGSMGKLSRNSPVGS
jgi:amino acid efflux transporter